MSSRISWSTSAGDQRCVGDVSPRRGCWRTKRLVASVSDVVLHWRFRLSGDDDPYMTTRRDAVRLLGAMSVAMVTTSRKALAESVAGASLRRTAQGTADPVLAAGAPLSPERLALIATFKERSAGIEREFEARTHKSDWVMPYRLFRPKGSGKLPLVVFLHGSGGLGDDNVKQLGLGNIFGTRLWALPDNQKEFPCYVLAPQTDRGWVKYGAPSPGDSVARAVPGFGDGARVALDIIDSLRREHPIDDQRIYLCGQSMGGGGVWHMTAQRPGFFAAAVACCSSATFDDPTRSAATSIWNFHGDVDKTVPVAVSRDRINAIRKAGGRIFSTEYAGVGHNSWEWAFTEPALPRWLFSKRRVR
jgi:predicted peptidase